MIKVGDRILEISSIRAVDRVRLERSVRRWGSSVGAGYCQGTPEDEA